MCKISSKCTLHERLVERLQKTGSKPVLYKTDSRLEPNFKTGSVLKPSKFLLLNSKGEIETIKKE
ncbi:hypothetical protein BpHYR1_000606 [Brachionus plicatilis]|uniref:Uncharacterized protein n=1 Tax=Brachionus plicatilis TaxID=10195 RepID=A0A3M7R5S2_BRAPC|nr:hypothetical protein BpHYR1_000606 [Brachionus plicatilis]